MHEFRDIVEDLRKFAEERDWGQFHSPKNLAIALAVEVAELLEKFQWLTEEQSKSLPEEDILEVADEVADIQLYLMQIADKLEIDVLEKAREKIKKNAERYPVDKSRGSAKKYTRLSD